MHKSETESLGQLFDALAKAQEKMEAATTSAINPFFKSKYAKLEHVVAASRPHLAKHGLSMVQRPVVDDKGQLVLLTRLCHSSGEWMESSMPINPPKTDIQSMGSYITYLRRYNYACIAGVVTEDEADDDGELAKNAQKKEKEVYTMSDATVLKLAIEAADKIKVSNYDRLGEFLLKFKKNLSTIANPLDSICSDKFIAGYEKWLVENPVTA